MEKKYISAFLVLVILVSSIYFMIPSKVRIDFEKTKTIFKVYEDGKFVTSGIEYTRIFDGTKLMRAKNRAVEYTINDDTSEVYRISNFKDGIVTEDFYEFSNQETDIENVPISHEICFTNATGKIFEYLVSNIEYDGITQQITSPFSFGKNMKVTFQGGYYRAKVVQNKIAPDKIVVRYRIDSDYECFDVRLFDPVLIYTNNFTLAGNITLDDDVDSVAYDGTYVYAGTWGEGLVALTFDGTTFTQVANITGTSPDLRYVADIELNGTTIFVAGPYEVVALNFNGTDFTVLDSYTTSGGMKSVNLITNSTGGMFTVSSHDTQGIRMYPWNGTDFGDVKWNFIDGAARTYTTYAYNFTRMFMMQSSYDLTYVNASDTQNFTKVDNDGTYYAYYGYFDPNTDTLFTASGSDYYGPGCQEGLVAWDVTDTAITYAGQSKSIWNKSSAWPFTDEKFVYTAGRTNEPINIITYSSGTFTSFQNISVVGNALQFAGNYSDYLFAAIHSGGLVAYEFNASTDIEPDGVVYSPVIPSHESGWTQNVDWTYSGGVASRITDAAHTGYYGAKITQTGGANTLLYQNLTNATGRLTNGTNYIASAWIYIPSGQVGENMHGELAMGEGISTQDKRRTYGSINTSNTTDTWMQINLTFTYDNSTDLYFDMFADGSVSGGGYVYWDDAYIFNYTAVDPSPTITFIYPTNGSTYLDNYTGYINISIDESGNCSLNDARWDYNSGNTTFSSFLNNTVISPATININVSCWDILLNNGSEILTFTVSTVTPSTPSNGTIWMTPISNYSNSLWMIDFVLDGGNVTAYDTSCGAIPTSSSTNVTAHKTGTYALSYNAERTVLGRVEQNRFGLYKFPRRFYANTLRTFFQFNTTLTANVTIQVNVNMTDVFNNTGISSDLNTSTARLYHISRNGGIYNDTGICYEQPISISS